MQDVDRSSFERVEAVRALYLQTQKRRSRKGTAAVDAGGTAGRSAPGSKPNAAAKGRRKVHIIGICGTGMAAVLQLLKHYDFTVSGSDKSFYPPMGDIVRKHADRLHEGYAAEQIDPDVDLVVIGNSVSRDNPEVAAVFSRGLLYASMPEVFAALLIGDRENCAVSIVVAGTHGKTTTTTAAAFLLESAGLKPGYFIGGAPIDLPAGIRPVSQDLPPEMRTVVLEGDEYDSAFFAKWPKFHSYRPDIVIVTSLEFDHGDIYRSVEEIQDEFTKLIRRLPAGGTALICDRWPRLAALAERWRGDPQIRAAIVMYGDEIGSPFRIKLRAALPDIQKHLVHPPEQACTPDGADAGISIPGQQLVLELNGKECRAVSCLTGGHNALNLCAAAAAATLAGASSDQITRGIELFHGVLRRQTVRFDRNEVTVIEDFAHHPTAISATLRALRESYPQRRIIAVYEPRSATGRRGYFQDDYPESFSSADIALIQEVADAGKYSGTGSEIIPLDVKKITTALNAQAKDARALPTAAQIEAALLAEVRRGDVIVIMSNGDFGGLIANLVKALNSRF